MNVIEQPYQTPKGYVDSPFAYVYDATELTDGATYYSIGKQLQGDSEFILRRIVGVPNCIAAAQAGGRWNYKNPSGSYTAGNPGTGIVANNCWPVLPEKRYSANRQIVFDLYDVSRAFNACGGSPIYYSYIAFMGVKRFTENQGYGLNQTKYRYRSLKYSYSFSLTVDWAGGANTTPQQFAQLLDVYDFELMRISIAAANSPGSPAALQTQDFGITLYDSNSHQLSDMPLPQGYINNGRRSPSLGPSYAGIWPVPSLVYPGGGQIKFDIQSFLCATSLPQSYNITFDGIWRVPC